jgi:pimeloyl-ACP methyl ester carboxylesterase
MPPETDFFFPHISFREQASGGGIRRIPEITPEALNGGRIILLIHGYNNDQHDTTAAYRGMFALQAQQGGLPGKIVGVYWPGDNWENFAFYMQSIGHAVDTAGLLAAVIRDAAKKFGILNLSIVSHSMGGRLAFELLRQLQNGHDGIVIERLALMAAAVATFALQPPSPSRARPLRAAFDTYRPTPALLSLFSPDDPVLSRAFPLGQSLAGEGFFPTALGHANWSGSGALLRPPLTQTLNPGARHGGYWFDGAEARFAQTKVHEFLDVAGAPPRAPAASVVMPRMTEPPRGTASRSTTTRDSVAM